MARIARNLLTLEPLSDGRWKLSGYFKGERIRRFSRQVHELREAKAKMEQQLDIEAKAAEILHVHRTRLTAEQIRDAEAAVQRAGGRSLLECVITAERIFPVGDSQTCDEALRQWLTVLAERKRFARTVQKNRLRVEAFLKQSKAVSLLEITPEMVERFVYVKGADFTRTTNGQVIRAWLNFCVKRRWLRASPFEVDMADLSATAKPVQQARILTPEQCERLLGAARSVRGGMLEAYAILTTWCFLRHAEALRVALADLKLDGKTPLVEIRPRKRGTVSYRAVTVPENLLPVFRRAIAAEAFHVTPATKRKSERRALTPPFSRSTWETVRAAAGLITLGDKAKRGGKRGIVKTEWQDNLLRHTGISYFYQMTGDIKETCRQAGNSDDTAFRHYLNLPAEGAATRFYAVQ